MRFPLTLKVSGWLLLNLALLAALGTGFLISQKGLNWNALVEGPPGRRIQDLVNAAVGDLQNLPPSSRDEALSRFAKNCGVSAALMGARGQILTGSLPFPLNRPLFGAIALKRRFAKRYCK